MDLSSSSSCRRSTYGRNYEKRHHEKFVSRVISQAIRGQNCPICLNILSDRRAAVLTACNHAYCLECIRKWSNLKRNCPLCNAAFDSWFSRINLSARNFFHHQLQPLRKGKTVISPSHHGPRSPQPQRIIQRSRDELIHAGRRARQFPWRRSFGRPGSVPEHVVAERKLRWRASVYGQRLQAVPLSPRNCADRIFSLNNFAKERILQKIEPWIRRELQAILGDPDPSVIVHVASSVFIATSLGGKCNAPSLPSSQLGGEDDFLAPLRTFLHNQTDMFWHELRCFAESSFTMETYDAVVEYKQLD